MCGIVGAVAQRDVAEILINGLHHERRPKIFPDL